jgi:hypothetical protein
MVDLEIVVDYERFKFFIFTLAPDFQMLLW